MSTDSVERVITPIFPMPVSSPAVTPTVQSMSLTRGAPSGAVLT
jgi:hypothetical protein